MATIILLGLLVQGPAGPDRLIYGDRSELRGDLAGLDASGALLFRESASGRTLNVAPEEVWRIAFDVELPADEEKAGEESVRLAHGGSLSGRRVRFDEGQAVVEHAAGTFRLRRAEIRLILLGPPGGPLPEIKEGSEDVVVREDEKKNLVAELGRLKSIGDTVTLESAGAERAFPRASVRQVLLRGEAPRSLDAPSGWFAKLAFRNGDKLVGVLRGASPGKLAFFSTALGAVDLDRRQLRSVTFVPTARLSVGHLLICDQAGVRELDRTGREVWSYQQNAQYAWSARKLENGNVLVANTNFNEVIEIRPTGRTGGEIVWRQQQANYPYDAVRLDNGNTLVAEYATNRVVEYDARTKLPAWQHAIDYPHAVQRLENGNTLICTSVSVVEVDRQNRERWKLAAPGVRPHRAVRLENGNTLVVDHQRGRVSEFDAQSVEIWKQQALSRPVQAIRLDDGGTLILEQGANRILEVDVSGTRRTLPGIRDLRYPQGMSMY